MYLLLLFDHFLLLLLQQKLFDQLLARARGALSWSW
jgi:hypothetical protein